MMIKNITKLQVEHQGRDFSLLCEMDTKVADLIEVLDTMKAMCLEIVKQHQEAEEKKAEVEA